MGNDKDNDGEHGGGEILLNTDLATGMLTSGDVYKRTATWDEACEKLLHTKCQAYTIALFRLVCIHWFQPIFYWLIFIAYKNNLDATQLILGYIVGIREIIYIGLTLFCLKRNPAFLLVDVVGTFNDSKIDFITYVFAPEKFIYLCLGLKTKFICGIDVVLMVLIVFDLFGIAALVAAIDNRVTPPLLIVGYMVTTIGGILYGTLLLFQAWTKVMGILCCRGNASNLGTMSEIDGMLKGIFPIRANIDLSGRGITDKDCKVIGLLLKENSTLTTLNLHNNNITDVQSIGEGLKTNNTLTTLYLGRNNITDVQSIGEGLKTNKTLLSLYLHDNKITDNGGIQSIIDGLKTNNTLKYLSLNYNRLSDNMKSQLKAIQQYKRDGSNGYQQVEGMAIYYYIIQILFA